MFIAIGCTMLLLLLYTYQQERRIDKLRESLRMNTTLLNTMAKLMEEQAINRAKKTELLMELAKKVNGWEDK